MVGLGRFNPLLEGRAYDEKDTDNFLSPGIFFIKRPII